LETYEIAVRGSNGSIEVSIADLAAVAASSGLDAPEAGRDEKKRSPGREARFAHN
jgi:hypothetical protein